MTSAATITLWGTEIAAVAWDNDKEIAIFEYYPHFINSGIEVAPLKMPLNSTRYSFPELNRPTFKGLPGMLADALPDKFGNALINRWLEDIGVPQQSFTPVNRLCYIGKRAMGALEFIPTEGPKQQTAGDILDVSKMVIIANHILHKQENMHSQLAPDNDDINQQALKDILQVGVSAGGARAKAVIAWDRTSNTIKSGQLALPPGYEHWLLKFDGITNNKDKELADPQGFGKIEYAYHKMATDAGIEMAECFLLEENNRHHFMTKRFDRTNEGKKLHMQSLCALQHYDFNTPAYSYEQAMITAEALHLGMHTIEQLFLRAVFNICSRNQDDHTKNIAFLMNSRGEWRLAPAFDLTFAYNPSGQWTYQHQMSLNGKKSNFNRDDFIATADRFNIPKNRANNLIEQVEKSIIQWPQYAEAANVNTAQIEAIQSLLVTP